MDRVQIPCVSRVMDPAVSLDGRPCRSERREPRPSDQGAFMPPIVRRIRLGITNCYLLGQDRAWVLVDAGNRGWAGHFWRKLAAWGCRPSDFRLIVITHAHFDHVGSLAAIRRRCDCPVAVHRLEASWLADGRIVLPPGLRCHTQILIDLARRHPRLVRRCYRFEPVKAEILVEQEFSLAPFGIAADVPGADWYNHMK